MSERYSSYEFVEHSRSTDRTPRRGVRNARSCDGVILGGLQPSVESELQPSPPEDVVAVVASAAL